MRNIIHLGENARSTGSNSHSKAALWGDIETHFGTRLHGHELFSHTRTNRE